MRFQIFCSLLLSLALSGTARADAMHYTTLGAKKAELTAPGVKVKSLNFAREEVARKEAAEADAAKNKTFEQVWDRYRALAEGRADEQNAAPVKDVAKPVRPKVISAKPSALPQIAPVAPGPSVTGTKTQYREKPLARDMNARPTGILDQYEQSKARRSQMKMIRLGVPKEDAAPKTQTVAETDQAVADRSEN